MNGFSAADRASEQGSRLVREWNELEGALLVPTAVPVGVAPSEKQGVVSDGTFLLADDAVVCHDEDSEAPIVPSSTSLNNPLRDKAQVRRATQQGRTAADSEAEDIERGNRRVYAINYWNQQEIERANKVAASLNRKEEGGLLQTADGVLQELAAKPVPPALRPPPVPYKGTSGREYEVSKYDVTSYDTKEYDVSEYKSIYEK